MLQTFVQSPVGPLRLVASDESLVGAWFSNQRHMPDVEADAGTNAVLELATEELTGYFRGVRSVFTTPLSLVGTPFQRQVWAALLAIPYGATRSYKELARAIGRPNAVRAVGGANSRNPLSIFVPCHRVVAADGDLTGYDGGLRVKEWLLELEGSGTNLGGRRQIALPLR